MATLRGDPSDGLPGVPGVGEKTAAKLLAQYGDLAGILAARDAGDKGLTTTQRRRLQEADAYLRVAPVVVQVARDAPLPEFDPAVPKAPADPDALAALTTEWGLQSSVGRVRTAFGWA
jgi:5'-3' exonuclease